VVAHKGLSWVKENMAIERSKQLKGPINSILLVQLGDIGDVVLSFPCIRSLRETYPETKILVVVRDKAAELIRLCPWASGVIPIKKEKSLFSKIVSSIKLVFFLIKQHTDLSIDLRTGTRGAILVWFSRAKNRVGFYSSDGKFWRNRVFTDLVHAEYCPDQHVVDYLLDFLRLFNICVSDREPQMVIPKDLFIQAKQIISKKVHSDRYMVVQPFSLWRYKEWGEDNFVKLIEWIIRKFDLSVLVTGSLNERDRAENITRQCGLRCHNLAGKTSLDVYSALLEKAEMFIGGDSAGLHLAAATGTSTIAIFGPSSPKSWAPRGARHLVIQKKMPCVPCRNKGCDGTERSKCIENLSVDEVCACVQKHLISLGKKADET